MNSARIPLFDVAKGIGIISVVIGHSMTKCFLRDCIFSYHIALFFFLSGCLFVSGKYIFSTLLSERVKSLLVPLLIFLILDRVLNNLFYNVPIFKFVTEQSLPDVLWFIPVLFLSELSFFLIQKVVSKNKIILLSTLLSMALVTFILFKSSITVSYSLDVVPIATFYYGVGYLAKEFYHKNVNMFHRLAEHSYLLICLPILVIVVFTYITDSSVDLRWRSLPSISHIFIAFAGIALILILSNICLGNRYLKSILSFWGRNSLIVMCTHMFFLHIAFTYLYDLPFVLFKFIQQIIVWGAVSIIIFAINSKAKWIIGKW